MRPVKMIAPTAGRPMRNTPTMRLREVSAA
jgi:hypothetical protein